VGRRTALTFPLLPPPQKNVSLPFDSSPDTAIPAGISSCSRTSPLFGPIRRSSLFSASQVPCQSSPSTQVMPVTKRFDSMVRRIAGSKLSHRQSFSNTLLARLNRVIKMNVCECFRAGPRCARCVWCGALFPPSESAFVRYFLVSRRALRRSGISAAAKLMSRPESTCTVSSGIKRYT
jgi:hypothetical protein